MTIHMVKLCVGADDVDDLRNWQKRLLQSSPAPFHQTRMVPKRGDELMAGGSIYWVIRNVIQARQLITDVREIEDRGGRRACELVFDPNIVLVDPTPKRPFQGWRYLKPADVPADLKGGDVDVPSALRSQLKEAMVW